jgi:CHAT domain-containing protein
MLRRSLFLFLCSLLLCLWLSPTSIAQTPANQQVQTGVELYQSGKFQAAIAQWQQALDAYGTSGNPHNRAIVYENLARTTQHIGQTNQSLQYWTNAVNLYRQIEDRASLGLALIEQAQAHSRLGQYSNAIAILCNSQPCAAESAVAIAQSLPDSSVIVAALGSLGDAYRLRGNYSQAEEILEQALEKARSLSNPPYLIATLNSLGNIALSQAQGQYRRAEAAKLAGETELPGNIRDAEALVEKGQAFDQQAITYFTESITLAQQSDRPLEQTRALISLIPIRYRQQTTAPVEQAIALVNTLPPSADKVYAILDLVSLLQPPTNICSSLSQPQAIPLLETAIKTAQSLEETRSASFAVGKLGQVYECKGELDQAWNLTQTAMLKADQDLRAKDSLYLWEWQAGRILKQQGKEQEAIALYEQAIRTLEDIRSDLISANKEQQFDFRDAVDPLYRQLIELRLELEGNPQSNIRSISPNINSVLRTLDSLRLAELQNYFGNDCIITPIPVDPAQSRSQQFPNTAFFNSIILDQQTAIVVRFSDQTEQVTVINDSSETLRETIRKYRIALESGRFLAFVPTDAQDIYQWVIAPFEDSLKQKGIDTLVFTQDGVLRNVPMSALVNPATQRYLIEDYAIATTPSLTLTDPAPLQRKRLRALALGLTEASIVDDRPFAPLGNVQQETQNIIDQLPGSERLLDKAFTTQALEKELDRATYPIIHIATHGEFGSDAEDTFLITGDQRKLTITDLDTILRRTTDETIELLTLTACQTARGDERSALGLAGVAVQAGAKSALASLWFIDDATTAKLITQFYVNLKDPSLSKARALQKAQISILAQGGREARPGYWAPFILVGNWL